MLRWIDKIRDPQRRTIRDAGAEKKGVSHLMLRFLPVITATSSLLDILAWNRQEGSVLYFTYFRESACSVSMVVTAKRSAIDGALVQELYILGLTLVKSPARPYSPVPRFERI